MLPVPAPADLATGPGVHDAVLEGHRFRCQVDDTELGTLLGRLAGIGVVSLSCAPPTLEELFLRHYGEGSPGPSDTGRPGRHAERET